MIPVQKLIQLMCARAERNVASSSYINFLRHEKKRQREIDEKRRAEGAGARVFFFLSVHIHLLYIYIYTVRVPERRWRRA